MGGHTIEELATEAARRIREYEREHERHAGFDDVRLAVRIVTAELGGALYERKILRRTIDILTGR